MFTKIPRVVIYNTKIQPGGVLLPYMGYMAINVQPGTVF